MKYFEGDIVEIITGKYKDRRDAHKSGHPPNLAASFPGQRFRVTGLYKNDIYGSPGADINDVRLYKRPFKNWIKATFK